MIRLIYPQAVMKVNAMKVKLSDILEAFEMNDMYSEYFIDKETGEVVQVNDMMMTADEKEEVCDRLDEHGFYRLPSSYDIRDFDLMSGSIDTLSGSPRSKLLDAVTNRHPFSSFKNELRKLHMEEKWYTFQADAYRRMAINWCKEHDVEYEP